MFQNPDAHYGNCVHMFENKLGNQPKETERTAETILSQNGLLKMNDDLSSCRAWSCSFVSHGNAPRSHLRSEPRISVPFTSRTLVDIWKKMTGSINVADIQQRNTYLVPASPRAL
jgi:hypothetical protein